MMREMNFGLVGRGGPQVVGPIEFAPSLGWFCLMLLPLACQYPTLHPLARDLQLGLAAAIAVLLLVADGLAWRMGRSRAVAGPGGDARGGLWLIGVCFLVPVMAHLVLMPRYPLLEWLVHEDLPYQTLMRMRDESSKFLELPSLVKYVFNWAVFIFAPVLIGVSIHLGRWVQAIAALLLAVLYAGMTLARLPLLLLGMGCVFALLALPIRHRTALARALAAMALVGALLASAIVLSGTMQRLSEPSVRHLPATITDLSPDDPRRAMSYGDYFRLPAEPGAAARAPLLQAMEYLLYRGWLTPSDVSNRWYQYYSQVASERLGLQFLLPGPRNATAQTPSRVVGVWAYQSRFPYRYNSTISANASFDADAYAHAGVPGVLLALALLLAARLGAAWLLTTGPLALAAYGVLLGLLAVLPSSASLQAIFGANGLAIVPLLLLAIRQYGNKA